VRSTWEFSWRYFTSYCLTFGIAYLATIALGAVSGATAVGSVRGAQLLLSPLTLALAAAVNTLAVQIVRESMSGPALRLRMMKVSFALSAGAGLVTTVLLVLPDAAGRLALGDSWVGAQRLILPAGAQAVLIGALAGAKIGMTGSRAVRSMLRLDVFMAPLLAVVPITCALAADSSGFLWALTACHVVIATIWWRAFSRLTAGPPSPSDPMGGSAEVPARREEQ
jgi:hypothetical protein